MLPKNLFVLRYHSPATIKKHGFVRAFFFEDSFVFRESIGASRNFLIKSQIGILMAVLPFSFACADAFRQSSAIFITPSRWAANRSYAAGASRRG